MLFWPQTVVLVGHKTTNHSASVSATSSARGRVKLDFIWMWSVVIIWCQPVQQPPEIIQSHRQKTEISAEYLRKHTCAFHLYTPEHRLTHSGFS